MRTETPRARQLTFQLGHADIENSGPVFLSSQQKERRFVPASKVGISAPEMQ
jgi:hypothetical protein